MHRQVKPKLFKFFFNASDGGISFLVRRYIQFGIKTVLNFFAVFHFKTRALTVDGAA